MLAVNDSSILCKRVNYNNSKELLIWLLTVHWLEAEACRLKAVLTVGHDIN